MRPARRCSFVFVLAFLAGSAFGQPPPPDENLLNQAKVNSTDGASLVELFSNRVPGDASADKIVGLVNQLADEKTRDQAYTALVKLGPAAVPYLRPAANDVDNLAAQALARQCLFHIEGPTGANVMIAAARKLAALHPAGAVPAMLQYLPFADNDGVAGEVVRAMVTITALDRKGDPALIKALNDPSPIRRIAAIDALSPLDDESHRPALRKLLKDPKASVRMRVAMGLSNVNEEAAIPVLIDLMGELPLQPRTEVQTQLQKIAGPWTVFPPTADDDIAKRVRREVWLGWWQSLEGPVLLDEFKKRTLTDVDYAKLLGLIDNLGDDTLATREKALDDIVAMGPRVLAVLRQQQGQKNPRIASYLSRCFVILDPEKIPPLPQPTARLIALRKPAGAAEALLAFLPFAENQAMRQQVTTALRSVAVREGKVDAALAAAITDKLAVRRVAAGEVLAEAGSNDDRVAARKLLQDPDPQVRIQVGFALVAARDRATIPALIDMLPDLPIDYGAGVEDLLLRLAGDKAPSAPLQGDETARKKCRDAWAKWWKDQGESIDLAKIANPRWLFGQTLIVDDSGRVLELDVRGNVCWQITGIPGIRDAQMLPNGHVLVLENGGLRITERDITGTVIKTIWDKPQPVFPPLNCVGFQRLANGNTFIAMRHQIIEVDGDKKETVLYTRPQQNQQDIYTARKLPDGQIAFTTVQWNTPVGLQLPTYYRLDGKMQEAKSYQLTNFVQFDNRNVEILTDDRVLMTVQQQNTVFDFDNTGKIVDKVTALAAPSHAIRLANGHLLVASAPSMKIVEIDASGRVVWEYAENIRPSRVHRR